MKVRCQPAFQSLSLPRPLRNAPSRSGQGSPPGLSIIAFLPILPLLGLSSLAFGQESQGYAELRAHMNLGVAGEPVQLVESVRPTFTRSFGERFALTATVQAAFTQGRSLQDELERTFTGSELGPTLAALGCTWPHETNETLDISSARDYLSLDRLYVDAYLPKLDLRLGRQPVNWGSAMVVNPTDPFPEVLAVEPWRPRAGVNALRATVPLGTSAQIQAVAGSNDAFDGARLALRATKSFGLTDVSLMGAWRQEADNGIVGLDIRGTLGVGYWLEGAVHLRREAAGKPYEEVAVGVDYSFPVLEKLVVSAQYYRNGSATDAQAAGEEATSSAFSTVAGPDCGGVSLFGSSSTTTDRFAPFFHGRDYGMLSLGLSVNSEVSLSGLWIQNLDDGTGLAVPVVTWVPNGWLELSVAAQTPFSLWGSGGELHPSDESLQLEVNTGASTAHVDLSGLVADAVVILWTRINF